MNYLNIKQKLSKKWFYKRSLKDKLKVLYLTLATIYIFIFILIMFMIYQELANHSDYINKYLNLIVNNVEKDVNSIRKISESIVEDKTIRSYLKIKNNKNYEINSAHYEAEDSLRNICNIKKYVLSVWVFRLNPSNNCIKKEFMERINVISNKSRYSNDIYNQQIEELKVEDIINDLVNSEKKRKINDNIIKNKILEKNGNEYIDIIKKVKKIKKKGSGNLNKGYFQYFSYAKIINDRDDQEEIGVLVINFNMNIIEKNAKLKQDDENEDDYEEIDEEIAKNKNYDKKFTPCYYIQKSKDNYISEKNAEKFVLVESKEKKEQLKHNFDKVTGKEIKSLNIVINGKKESSIKEYLAFKDKENYLYILIIFGLIFFSLTIYRVFVSSFIVKPIDEFIKYINTLKYRSQRKNLQNKQKFEKNNFDFEVFDSSLIEINQIIEELLSKEKLMRRTELQSLQEQINPHFLYNSLGMIADMALKGNNDKVYDTVETLGSFYRKFLSRGSKEIKLREEIAIVKDYLKLQKLRYQDTFDDEYDLNDELLDILVPKLILQPLVENSIYHGIRLKGDKGIIKISVLKANNFIYIVIYDTGIGMNSEKINQLMSDDNKKSFGFKSTMERIKYYFDFDNIFRVKSEEGLYCEVTIKIPFGG